jgi:hypothetical protein
LQENRPTGREFRQNQLPEFATFSLKNLQILDFSQSTVSPALWRAMTVVLQ